MSRLSRQESQRQTRERIMRAAEDLLATQGGKGGIEQIARAAGYTRGAFYKNYVDRSALLLDILRTREAAEILFWTTLFQSAGDLEQTMSIVVEQSRALAKARALVSIELQLEAERNPAFRPHHAAYLRSIYRHTRELLEAMLARYGRAAPPDLDEQAAGLYAFSLTFGLSTLSASGEEWARIASRLASQRLTAIIESAPPLERAEGTEASTGDAGS